jgi:hypothetical protein
LALAIQMHDDSKTGSYHAGEPSQFRDVGRRPRRSNGSKLAQTTVAARVASSISHLTTDSVRPQAIHTLAGGLPLGSVRGVEYASMLVVPAESGIGKVLLIIFSIAEAELLVRPNVVRL